MVVFSLEIEGENLGQCGIHFCVDIAQLFNLLPNPDQVLKAVMMLSQCQLLVSLTDLQHFNSILLVLEPCLGLFKESNRFFNALKLSAAGDGDQRVAQWVKLVVHLKDHLVVEFNQLFAFTSVESSIADVCQHSSGHLMPQFGQVEGFQAVYLFGQARKLSRMLIKYSIYLFLSNSRHMFLKIY